MNGTMTKESNFVKNRAKLFACRSEEEVCSDRKAKTPSYVSLSCAVSGYSGLNRYDSNRARDSSRDRPLLPLCMSGSRDSSPSPTKPSLISSNRQSSAGFILSSDRSDISVTDHASTTIHSQSRSKSVDRGFLRQNFLNGHLQYKPPTGSVTTTYKTTFSTNVNGESSSTERGRVRIRSSTAPQEMNGSSQDSKSVIQQRIERLYGPAALARGFFLVKSPLKVGKEPVNGVPLNNNNISPAETAGPAECSTPPVFRHLNAEFRQQLKLKKRSPSIENNKTSVTIPVETATPLSNKSDPAAIITTNGSPASPTSNLDDGHKFLRILDEEKVRLECLIAKYEIYLLEPVIQSSEELTGKIRAAAGKGKLLLAQKFEQFAGLCRKNLTQSPDEPFPTTGQDLAGFWDMVTIQVDHIKALFAEIQQLKDNGWVEVDPPTSETMSNRAPAGKKSRANPNSNNTSGATSAPTPRSAKAEEAARAREEARRKMMDDKRKMMKAKKQQQSDGQTSIDWPVITEKVEPNLADGDETVV